MKRLISLLCVLGILMTDVGNLGLYVAAAPGDPEPAIVDSGEWKRDENNKGTWTIDENGVLTISGTGKMPDYNGVTDTPWNQYRQTTTPYITKVVVESGITYLSKNMLTRAYQLTEIDLSNCGTLQGTSGGDLFKMNNYGGESGTGHLNRVDLSGNPGLTGFGSNAFSTVRTIQYLDISGTKISADYIRQENTGFGTSKGSLLTIKANGCTTSFASLNLSDFSKLETLELNNCTNLTTLTNLPNTLETLELTGTGVTALDLTGKTKLTTLKLPNGITSLTLPTTCAAGMTIYFDGTLSQWNDKGFTVPEGVSLICNEEYFSDLNRFLQDGSYYTCNGEAAQYSISAPAVLNQPETDVLHLHLLFAETNEYLLMQEPLSYTLPAGLTLLDEGTVTVGYAGVSCGYSYDSTTRKVTLNWDWGTLTDEQKQDAWAAIRQAGFWLELPVQAVVADLPLAADLGNNHILRADSLHNPMITSVSGTYNDNNTITYTVTVEADGSVNASVYPVVVSVSSPGSALDAPAASSYTINTDMANGATQTFTFTFPVNLGDVAYLATPTAAELGITASLTNEGNHFNLTGDDTKTVTDQDIRDMNIHLPADMTASGETTGRGMDENDWPYQDITWTVVSNAGKALPQGGSIYGTIDYTVKPAGFAGQIGDAVVMVSNDQDVLIAELTAQDLQWDTADGLANWHWTVPEAYKGQNYTFTLRFTTRFQLKSEDYDDPFDVTNTITGHTGSAEATAKLKFFVKDELDTLQVTQEAVYVDAEKVTWKITVSVPGAYDSFTVRDILPMLEKGGAWYQDSPFLTGVLDDGAWHNAADLAGYLTVTGLVEGRETYRVRATPGESWENALLELKFYCDDDEGLLANGARQIVITLTTRNNAAWLDLPGLTWEEKVHTNRVEVRGDEYVYAEAEAAATPQKPYLDLYPAKNGEKLEPGLKVREVRIDGVSYPVFAFVLTLGGVTESMLEGGRLVITDTLAGDDDQAAYWTIYQVDADADVYGLNPRVYGTSTGAYPTAAAAKALGGLTAVCDDHGVITFTLDPELKNNDYEHSYWDHYQIVFHVIPKNAEALRKLKELAVEVDVDAGETADDVGKQVFTSSAALTSWHHETESGPDADTADYVFEYVPIRKELTGMDGNWAYYRIDVNPDELPLNPLSADPEAGLTLKDTFYYDDKTQQGQALLAAYPNYVSQSIDYSSIRVYLEDNCLDGKDEFRAAGISYDYSGYTGTFQVPDGRHIIITYRTRVSGEGGSTVTFSNTAELTNSDSTTYTRKLIEADRWIYPGADDLTGTEGDNYIRLFKYAQGHMEYGLAGAEFLLHDANMNLITGLNGEPVKFTTGPDGYVTIRLDQAQTGFGLKKNTVYYLEETRAPIDGSSYYKRDNTLYSFVISDNPNYNAGGVYVYYNNDVLKIRNREEEQGVFISLRFTGNYTPTEAEQKTIQFTLSWDTGSETIKYKEETSTGYTFYYGYEQFQAGNKNSPLAAGGVYRIAEDVSGLTLDSGVTLKTTWVVTTVDENGEYFTETYENEDFAEFTATASNLTHCIDILCINEFVEKKLTVKKVDKDNGKALGGANFTVYDAADQTVKTYTTKSGDKDDPSTGTLNVVKEPIYAWDTLYYITETKAPAGYVLPDQPERVYFYFSYEGSGVPAGLPEGKTAVDLSAGFDSVIIEDRPSAKDIPVRVAWDLEATGSAWPDGVDRVVIGLFASLNGGEESPVLGDMGQELTVSLTKAQPFNNQTFVNLAAEDNLGNKIAYTLRELHVYTAGGEDLIDRYAPSCTVTDADLHVVTNRDGTKITVKKVWYESGSIYQISGEELAKLPDITFDIYRTKAYFTDEQLAALADLGLDRDVIEAYLTNNGAELVRVGVRLGTSNAWKQLVGSLEAKYLELNDNGEVVRKPWYYIVLESQNSDMTDTYTLQDDALWTIKNVGTPQPICRIGTEEFKSLNEAMEYARDHDIYNPTIEMLKDYILPKADALQIPQGFTVTITTAEGFAPTDGSERTAAKITRYKTFLDGPLFLNYGKLILGNIVLDGGEVKAARALVDTQGTLEINGAVLQNAVNSDQGGAVLVRSGSLTVSGGTITGNKAAAGGAICNAGNGMITVSGGTITGNTAVGSGGAIYNAGVGTVSVSGGTITGNTAENGSGGAIYAVNGVVELTGGAVGGTGDGEANTAANYGGAVYAYGAVVNISETVSLIGNSAISGGAVYAESGSVTVSGGTIKENKVTGKGGGIYSGTGTVTVSDGSMTGNTAGEYGGAVYVGSGSLTMSGGTLGEDGANSAKNGAAVYINTGTAAFSGGTITGNKATDENGGAVGVGSSAVRITLDRGIRITGNLASDGTKEANLCLDRDSDEVIYVSSTLTITGNDKAKIGIYVPDSGSLIDKRGIPGSLFGGFVTITAEDSYNGIFVNDRYTGFQARADLSAKKLYWGMPLKLEVYRQIDKDHQTDYTSSYPIKDANRQWGPYDVYPRASSGAVSELAQSFYSQFKDRLGANSVTLSLLAFGSAFLATDTTFNSRNSTITEVEFQKYLTEYRWNKKDGAWEFTKRDGTTSLASNTNCLRVIYAKPAYISIENNTNLPESDPRTLTVTELSLTFGETEYSVFNGLGQIGYGYVVATNGETQSALLPLDENNRLVQNNRLVLEPGESIKLMIPGGCGLQYSFTASLAATTGTVKPSDPTKVLYTVGTEGTYASPTPEYLDSVNLGNTLLTASGGTYEILFGGMKPKCKIVVTADKHDSIQSAEGSNGKLYTSFAQQDPEKYEYLFTRISDAVDFAITHFNAQNATVTIEMLQDYLLPSTDKVEIDAAKFNEKYGKNISSIDIDFTFTTATTGKYWYQGAGGRAAISRDSGNANSFITAEAATAATAEVVSYHTIKLENLIFDGKNLAGSDDGGALNTKNWTVALENAEFKNFIAGNGGAVFVEFGIVGDKDTYPLDARLTNAWFTVKNVAFDNCRSVSTKKRQGGGAIWTNARVLEITADTGKRNTFRNCTAYDQGGAIFHRVDGFLTGTTTLTFPDAAEDDGTALYTATEETSGQNSGYTITKVERCDFTGCEGGAAGGMETDASIVKVNDCTFTDCRAVLRNGGGFNVYSNNKSDSKDVSLVWVKDSKFTNCHADNIDTVTYHGGGLRSAAKRTYVENCTFTDVSSNRGGAIACSNLNADVALLRGCVIKNAQASQEGGGIYSTALKTRIIDTEAGVHSSLMNCTAGLSGGGVWHYRDHNYSLLYMENCTVSSCRSTPATPTPDDGVAYGGGGIYSFGAVVQLVSCTVQNNTTTLNGGGICAARTLGSTKTHVMLDACVVTGSVAGECGGGVFSAGSVTLRNENVIMGNRLSRTSVDYAAGVWVSDEGTLYIEADDEVSGKKGTNNTRVSENYTGSGKASNLRLPMDDENEYNKTTGVQVKCHMGGTIGVVNAKSQGTQFGTTNPTTGAGKFVSPSGFMDLNHAFTADDGSLYGILDRSQELDNATNLVWAGEPMCKITDANGSLLYLAYNATIISPAIFDRLDGGADGSRISAFSLLRSTDLKLYNNQGDEVPGPYYVKLLVETYTAASPISTAGISPDIVLTTATSADGDGYPYRGTSGSRAAIRRDAGMASDQSLLTVNSNLTLRNIELDGASQAGRLLEVKEGGNVALEANARLKNATNGGAVLVSGGAFSMNGGEIQNCAASDGGGVNVASGSFTMNSGSIINCRATNNGGGVYVGGGSFTMKDGSIQRCTATQDGGGVYVAAGQTMRMEGGTISGNQAALRGGGITTGVTSAGEVATRLYFGGTAKVTGNTLANKDACNVELVDDANTVIQAAGLRNGANIGIYVSDAAIPSDQTYTLFGKHGDANKPFANFADNADQKYLYCFINDRNGLKGGVPTSGAYSHNTAYWVKIFTLRVEMNVLSDKAEDQDDIFTYTVTLYTDANRTIPATASTNPALPDGWYGAAPENVGETSTGMQFKNGVATFKLKSGEFKEADSLPEGLYYTIEQTPPAGKDGYYMELAENTNRGNDPPERGQIGENNKEGKKNYVSKVTFSNIHAVCKITDTNGNLLYYRLGSKNYQLAVYSDLGKAFKDINNKNLYSESGSSTAYDGDYYVKMLVDNYTLSSTVTLGGSGVAANRTVTLTTAETRDTNTDGYYYTGAGHATIKRAKDFTSSLLQVVKRGTLTLKNIILDGNGAVTTATQNGSLVRVSDQASDNKGGTVTIADGAVLKNAVSGNFGAAVYVYGGGSLTVSGGSIENNSGTVGTVYVQGSGSMAMSGGSIKGNSGTAGAVYVYEGGSLTMTGGSIENNTSTGDGPGIYLAEGSNMHISGRVWFADNTTVKDKPSTGVWTNGDAEYPSNGEDTTKYKIRQDILIAGYSGEDITAESLVVDGAFSKQDGRAAVGGDGGSIWVWAAAENHYKQNLQFALFTGLGESEIEDALRVFRNARDDVNTENGTLPDYLYGVQGEELPGTGKSLVMWSGVTGSRMVILRKVDQLNNLLSGATFDICKKNGAPYVIKGETPAQNVTLEDLATDETGVIWVGELPFGVYLLHEKAAPAGYGSDNTNHDWWYTLTVNAAGVTISEQRKTQAEP